MAWLRWCIVTKFSDEAGRRGDAPDARRLVVESHTWKQAATVFTRMLWMNPSDNQGARFNLSEVRASTPWEDRDEK